MTHRLTIAIILLCAITSAHGNTVVFTGVDLITMNGDEVLRNQVVLVEDGVIQTIVPATNFSVPDGATEIDGRGHYLMPGLAEMHAHIPPSRNREIMLEVLTLYLSQGITTIRGMLGEPGHLTARDDQLAGKLAAPRIIAGGPSLNGNSVTSPAQGAAMVSAQFEAGYDHLKIHPGLSADEFDAIAGQARELGMKFAGHVSPAYGALHALAQGQICIDHMDGFIQALVPADSPGFGVAPQFFGINLAGHADSSGIDAIARAVESAGAWVVPTETLMVSVAGPDDNGDLLTQPGTAYVSASTRASWQRARESVVGDDNFDPLQAARWLEIRRQLIASLHRHGQRLLLGSDAPQIFNIPGFSIHRELAIYVDAGLSPRDALATGNINVARYLGVAERRGKIAPGFDADLVLLRSNPLIDIAHSRSVQGVMVAGHWYSRGWLDEQLAGIAGKYAP
jgi:imidazolonepropionase-like amidohydrolase